MSNNLYLSSHFGNMSILFSVNTQINQKEETPYKLSSTYSIEAMAEREESLKTDMSYVADGKKKNVINDEQTSGDESEEIDISDDEIGEKSNLKQIIKPKFIGAAEKRLSAFAEHDLVIKIENKSLHVNKDQLMAASPVFKEMITPVANGTSENELQIDGKDVNTFVDFLRCTLPGFDENMTDKTVHDVVPLAYKYRTKQTIEKADIFLAGKCKQMSHKISSAQIVKNILQAEMYGLTTYLEECITIASRKCFDKIVKHRQFNEITDETRLKIAMKRWNDMDTAIKSTRTMNLPSQTADFYKPYSCSSAVTFGQHVSTLGSSSVTKPAKTPSSQLNILVESIEPFMHNN